MLSSADDFSNRAPAMLGETLPRLDKTDFLGLIQSYEVRKDLVIHADWSKCLLSWSMIRCGRLAAEHDGRFIYSN